MTQTESTQAPQAAASAKLQLQPCDVLILDSHLRQTLVTTRSLGSRGLRVAALAIGQKVPTFSSRWCQQPIICPAEEGTPEYLAFLEQVLDATHARTIITASDGTVSLLRKYREQLAPRVHIAIASEEALAIAVDKEQTLAIAQKLGIAIPRGTTIASVAELETALSEVGLPMVIKPVKSWIENEETAESTRMQAELVTTPEEARRAVEKLTALGGSVLCQQFLTGRRESVHMFYAQGQVYASFAQWAKRTEPPLGGTSVLRQSIAMPTDIGEPTERLIREINLEGYSEIEYRRDSAGTPYLMEINPRLSASIEVAVRAGVDFPYLLYQWANGEPLTEVKSYRVGGWMRYLEGDVVTTGAAIAQRGRPGVTPPLRAVLGFFGSFFVPMGYDYFDWRDPKPAWTAGLGLTRLVLKRIAQPFKKEKTTATPVQ